MPEWEGQDSHGRRSPEENRHDGPLVGLLDNLLARWDNHAFILRTRFL
jgi:hypothetical protein